MRSSIGATPFGERDRLDGERILQHLVQGRDVPKIATRALPPLADMPTLAMEARPPGPTPPPPRPRISAGRLAGLAGGGLVALGTIWLLGRPSRLPAPAVSASLDSAAGRPAPAAPSRPAVRRGVEAPSGRLRLLTTAADAEILIDGPRGGIRSLFDDVPICPRRPGL